MASMAEQQTLEHQGLLHSQVSKTARVENGSGEGDSGKAPVLTAVKLLNRDLIASSENLNDLSPKSGT